MAPRKFHPKLSHLNITEIQCTAFTGNKLLNFDQSYNNDILIVGIAIAAIK